jgi:hypothetical protein
MPHLRMYGVLAQTLRVTVHPSTRPIQASQFRLLLSIEEAKHAGGFDHLVTLSNGAAGRVPFWKHHLFLLRDCVAPNAVPSVHL